MVPLGTWVDAPHAVEVRVCAKINVNIVGVYHANSVHIHVCNGAVDTGKAPSRNRTSCGALWHHNVSKQDQFFS